MLFQSQAIANQAEKRQRLFDKTVDDWKRKVQDLQHELEQSLTDGRGNAADVYRLKAQLDESHDSTEAIRRENKHLAGEDYLLCFTMFTDSSLSDYFFCFFIIAA